MPQITASEATALVNDGDTILGAVGVVLDLAAGAKKLIIVINHVNSDGSGKIVPECTLPLTATKAVDLIITELAVVTFEHDALTLVEVIPGAALQGVQTKTAAKLAESVSLGIR